MLRLNKTVLVWDRKLAKLRKFLEPAHFLQELFPSGIISFRIISFKVNYIGITSFIFAGHM